MNVSQRFISSDGLIPSTIFDNGNGDMDTSEEMEEIRELLYETIHKNFPRGVASEHLAKKYREEYVSTKAGPELPSNWLEQVKAAEEFETQSRGPLTILFIRLHTSPKKNILQQSQPVSSPLVCVGRDTSSSLSSNPLQLAAMLSKTSFDSLSLSEPVRVIVSTYTNYNNFHIRLEESDKDFNELKDVMKKTYAGKENLGLKLEEVCVNGAYALCDSDGQLFRVIVQKVSSPSSIICSFVDVGLTGSFPLSSLRPLDIHSVQKCPSLCIRVHLDSLSPRRNLDDSLKSLLFSSSNGLLVPLPLRLVWMNEKKEGLARTVRMETEDGRNLKDVVEESCEANGGDRRSSLANCDSPSTISSCLSFGPLSDFDSPLPLSPMEPKSMPRRVFLAHCIYASGPFELSLRQASLDPMPDYLYTRLAEDSVEENAKLKGPPVPGELYSALIDDVWQRVQCIRSSKIHPTTFLVYLVDVGAFHYTNSCDIRRLNSLSPFKKMLAFKCKLFGVVPSGGVDVWSRDAQLAVNDFFSRCQEQPVEVVPRGEWTTWNQLNAPSLPMVEATIRSFDGRNLSDWLIYSGFAQVGL